MRVQFHEAAMAELVLVLAIAPDDSKPGYWRCRMIKE
jgi:hypothetical protein